MSSDDCNVIKIAEMMPNDEGKLDFLLFTLRTLEKELPEELQASICKNLAAAAIKKFSYLKLFQTDLRALEIWEFLARHSKSLGYGNIMERVHTNGYFTNLPELYEKWATFLYNNGNTYKLSEVRKLAEEYCPDKIRIETFFRDLGHIAIEETENLIFNLPKNQPPKEEKRKSLLSEKKPLSVVNEESYEKSRSLSSNGSGDARSTGFVSSKSGTNMNSPEIEVRNLPDSPVLVRTNIKEEMVDNESVPPANYSFTSHLKKSEVEIFGQTLPLSQEPQRDEQQLHGVQKDFSIFTDETVTIDQRKNVRHYVKETISESPVHKKTRESVSVENKAPTLFTVPLNDERTVSSAIKKGDIMVSTPTGDKFCEPIFDLTPTKVIARNENQVATNVVEKPKPLSAFSFAPAAAELFATEKKPKGKEPEPIVDSIKRMAINSPVQDDLETTRDYTICGDAVITSSIDPWGEKERLEILKRAPLMVEQHEFLSTKCPLFKINNTINMGGESFRIIKMIGQGGFAKVFKAENDERKPIAIKLEMPACPWEVYICKSVIARLDVRMQGFVMQVQDAYIFSNASAITYEYHSKDNLLELVNASNGLNGLLDGQIVAFIGSQIANILKYVHKANIIHTDIKPDNFLICDLLTEDAPKHQFMKPFVKLIDWGRGIDMTHFQKQTFTGRAGTESFDCIEMREGRPWTYQTDFFGYAGTMHVLMFGNYMKYFYHEPTEMYTTTESVKSRYPLSSVWKNIFKQCLNIPDCEHFPDWNNIVEELENKLQEHAASDIFSWKRAVTKCNEAIKSIES